MRPVRASKSKSKWIDRWAATATACAGIFLLALAGLSAMKPKPVRPFEPIPYQGPQHNANVLGSNAGIPASTTTELPTFSNETPELGFKSAIAAQSSANNILELMTEQIRGKLGPKDLVKELDLLLLKPQVQADSNDLGKMIIVRTERALPGTRYLHAQYFSNEAGEPEIQHMSFEIPPAPEAMKLGVSLVKSAFKELGEPALTRPNFVLWKAPNGFVVWVKRLSADELSEDPFNAYGPSDVGTIRIAIEHDIHENDDADGGD